LPPDYAERVYAGVLGKIIGVYLGRPIEGWSYDRITREIGEVDYYLKAASGAPLVVTDDDVTGTFTFLRALEDEGYPGDLSPARIGDTWLNYTISSGAPSSGGAASATPPSTRPTSGSSAASRRRRAAAGSATGE
jgi:ADP-ribosylglycohydrolase